MVDLLLVQVEALASHLGSAVKLERQDLQMVTHSIHAALAVLMIGSIAQATAGPPIVTDDPGTPGPRRWEINAAYTLEDSSSERRMELPLLDINYGVGEWIQLKYEVPFLLSKQMDDQTQSGFDRSIVGVKWRFKDKSRPEPHETAEGTEKVEGGESSGVALSTYPQYTFANLIPRSAQNIDAPTVNEFFLPIEAEESFGRWDLNEEAGYRWIESDAGHVALGLALTYKITEETASVLGELHDEMTSDFQHHELLADVGTILAMNEWSNFLFSIGRTFVEFDGEPNKILVYVAIQLHL